MTGGSCEFPSVSSECWRGRWSVLTNSLTTMPGLLVAADSLLGWSSTMPIASFSVSHSTLLVVVLIYQPSSNWLLVCSWSSWSCQHNVVWRGFIRSCRWRGRWRRSLWFWSCHPGRSRGFAWVRISDREWRLLSSPCPHTDRLMLLSPCPVYAVTCWSN